MPDDGGSRRGKAQYLNSAQETSIQARCTVPRDVRGEGATNNIAEYNAALDALRAVYRSGYRRPVRLHGDSELVVHQFNGKCKVNAPHLRELLDRRHHATTFFASVEVVPVPREQNAVADQESRLAYERERCAEVC